MRNWIGLVSLLGLPAAAAAQGAQGVACPQPNQALERQALEREGWMVIRIAETIGLETLQRAEFTRIINNIPTPPPPDRMTCFYGWLDEVKFVAVKNDIPSRTCEAMGWSYRQREWFAYTWTSDPANARLTCK